MMISYVAATNGFRGEKETSANGKDILLSCGFTCFLYAFLVLYFLWGSLACYDKLELLLGYPALFHSLIRFSVCPFLYSSLVFFLCAGKLKMQGIQPMIETYHNMPKDPTIIIEKKHNQTRNAAGKQKIIHELETETDEIITDTM